MAASLKQLVRKRGSIKGHLSRFEKFLSSDNINFTELEARLQNIEPLLAEFHDLQFQIECLEDAPDDKAYQDNDDFENQYYSLTSRAKEILNAQNKQEDEPSNSSNSQHSCGSTSKLVKLPQITLPTFSGGYEHFFSFKEQFNSLIDSREDLDTVQKFCYLRSALKGDALPVIASLETISKNYIKAWELLHSRFDNKRLVVGIHLREIYNTEKVDKASPSKLRKLVDTVSKHLRALESLELPVDKWDAPLVFYLQQKLDPTTIRGWEETCEKNRIPTLAEFLEFLASQAQILEALDSDRVKDRVEKSQSSLQGKRQSSNVAAADTIVNSEVATNHSNNGCPICSYQHKIYFCKKFLAMNINDRIQAIQDHSLCTNCLKDSFDHSVQNCRSSHCTKCNLKHNTLLHKENMHTRVPSCQREQTETIQSSTATHTSLSTVFLSTATVGVADKFGNLHSCRVLLDSGSQVNFITERLAQILCLPSFKRTAAICGIGGSKSAGHRGVNCHVSSQDNSFKIILECIILSKITLDIPTTSVDVSQWDMPSHITLADPAFFKKAPIDMLIGAAEFFDIMEKNRMPLGQGKPTLYSTKFGWVVSGRSSLPTENISSCSISDYGCSLGLEECLSKFWDIEEISAPRRLNPEEQTCEALFVTTTQQEPSGRFEVHLPVKHNVNQLGDNRETAMRRFFALERKLTRNQALRDSYVTFMQEYISLQHMSLVKDSSESSPIYYMPHHCVTNEHSSTTKLRVVFDGSCKSATGISLNDALMVGPTIQDDLSSIIIRFRQHKYVMTADITKMYRQVNVSPMHRNLQRIFWRESPDHDLKSYTLNTVTYGTGPASYLATRCLQELATLSAKSHPKGSVAVGRDFYVDDYLGGCDTLEEALDLQQQVIAVTKMGCFELHKWCSNNSTLIESIPFSQRETKYVIDSPTPCAIKTLGVWWNPSTDMFKYAIHTSQESIVTKRGILSEIARIFDPLGMLGPVNLCAKLFMKQLWASQTDWDKVLEPPLCDEWISFRNQLHKLEELEIPRLTLYGTQSQVEMHGFSDASEIAYGASIYLRSCDDRGKFHVYLLCSKSRVAPIKSISVPRLELCGALLLAQLAKKCYDAFDLPSLSCHLWTDSTVTLAWIAKPSGTWKTFVSNRVTEIHQLTHNFQWHHVPGSDNPSDLLSRGLMPEEILTSKIWWHGPSWLSQTQDSWPSQSQIPETIAEIRMVSNPIVINKRPVILFERFSNVNRLINSVVYTLRFIDHLPSKACIVGPITVIERERAIRQLIKVVQHESFSNELNNIMKDNHVSKKGMLAFLNPTLDQNGILRVGGRLDKSNLDYDWKHQIILPSGHHFTYLLVKSFHLKHLHAGPQLLLTIIRQQYWPLHGGSLVRKIFHSCKTCFRHNPKTTTPVMGELPAERVQPARPFINCGVDFCGPISIKSSMLRKSTTVKCYVSLFICLATKAVHIELVRDMSTASFLNALKRFFARRGKARNIFSDNGSNFVGASRELNNYLTNVLKDPSLNNYAVSEQISWHFIPPRAPHFGGIWEAAIKSLKFHLKRIVGSATLAFEEMCTVLCMIEACLNSRPLMPLTNHPDDLAALTPGHFLIGDSLSSIVEPDMKPYKEGSLKRWARLQKMYQHFWNRWSNEYLSSLQARHKWSTPQPNVNINKLVLVKEDNVPPLKWHLGRIVETHPGKDGLVRVVSVKTVEGIFKRPISKICLLPDQEDDPTISGGSQ